MEETIEEEPQFPIENYEEVEGEGGLLGEGAFGSVTLWKKKDGLEVTNTRPKYVALKSIRHPKGWKKSKMRKRELYILTKVQKGNVKNLIGYYGSFEDSYRTGKVTCLAMQVCHGDLKKLIDCRRVLSVDELKDIGKQLLLGLEYLHGSDDIAGAERDRIIHR